jgi:flagellar protein FlbD
MIQLTRFNGTRLFLNAEMIQTIEGTPDTIIQLSNGDKILVKEAPRLVVEKIIAYRRLVQHPELPVEVEQ